MQLSDLAVTITHTPLPNASFAPRTLTPWEIYPPKCVAKVSVPDPLSRQIWPPLTHQALLQGESDLALQYVLGIAPVIQRDLSQPWERLRFCHEVDEAVGGQGGA